MANVTAAKQRLRVYARNVHYEGHYLLRNDLIARTPLQTGRLRAAQGKPIVVTQNGDETHSTIDAPAGAGEPTDLPQWLDQGTEHLIVPVRAKALRFFPMGGSGPVFARSVRWRPRPSSVGFWSTTVTRDNWRRSLRIAARRVRY